MLVISRKIGERIQIGPDVWVRINAIRGRDVVIGIEADAAAALMEALEVRGGALVDDEILVGAVLAASLGLRDGDRLALLPGASDTG